MRKIDVSVNGKWLSEEIEGFVATDLSERELHSRKALSDSVKGIDGASFISSAYPDRVLKVGYCIQAPNNKARGSRYNKLASLLNFEQGKVIFSDEPDKFFIATPVSSDAKTIEFLCCDPYKYSTVQKEFTAENGIFTIENEGFPCEIEYEIKCETDNGFISIVSDQGAIELGNRLDVDIETYETTEKVITMEDVYSASDFNGPTYLNPERTTAGSVRKTTASADEPMADGSKGPVDWLDLESAGTGSGWHGGSKMVPVRTDSSGETGAADFDCYFYHWFEKGDLGQIGEQSITWLTADNQVIAAVKLYADVIGTNHAKAQWNIGNRIIRLTDFESNSSFLGNAFGSGCRGHDMLRKEGEKLTYYYGGQYMNAIAPEIKDMKCAKVQFCILVHRNEPNLTRNYIRSFEMTKLGVTGYRDAKNRYPAGCTIRIRQGKPYRDGMYVPGEEILGSTYFKAPSGTSTIRIRLSDWAGQYEAKARIRERWI